MPFYVFQNLPPNNIEKTMRQRAQAREAQKNKRTPRLF